MYANTDLVVWLSLAHFTNMSGWVVCVLFTEQWRRPVHESVNEYSQQCGRSSGCKFSDFTTVRGGGKIKCLRSFKKIFFKRLLMWVCSQADLLFTKMAFRRWKHVLCYQRPSGMLSKHLPFQPLSQRQQIQLHNIFKNKVVFSYFRQQRWSWIPNVSSFGCA